MPSPESGEFRTYLDELIEATRAGSVEWKPVNPTTYVWEAPGATGARLSIQRIDRTQPVTEDGHIKLRRVSSYLFQAFEMLGPAVKQRLSIESDEEPDLNPKFETLYEIAKTGLSRKGLDFLRKILPKS